MIQLSYNGELYSYDNKTSTTVSSTTAISVLLHPYVDIEGAKLFYSQGDTEGIVDINDNTADIPGAYLITGDLQVALRLASEEMSNTFTLNVTKINSSGDVTDDDIQFTMDNKKRLILVPGSQNLLAVQFDNQSEIITFKFPRYQEEVDLSTKIPYVNYKRPQREDLGKALCTIEEITEDTIYFSWLVDEAATQYEGIIQFQVEFTDSFGYRWQSQVGELPILVSLYNTGLEPYSPGVLEQYLQQIREYAQEAASSAEEGSSQVEAIQQKGEEVLASIPADYTELNQDVNNLKSAIDQGTGLTSDAKEALLACFRNLSWISDTDEYGNSYYDMLYDALYNTTWGITRVLSHCVANNAISEVKKGDPYSVAITASAGYTLVGADVMVTMGGIDITGIAYSNGTVSIAAVTGAVVITVEAAAKVLSSIRVSFVQGSAVFYEGQSLDGLREYLTVTATYSDASTAEVTDYTLSGALTSGTSSVTAEYGGKTDVFYVTVAGQPDVYQDTQGYIVLSPATGTHVVTQTDGYIILAAS